MDKLQEAITLIRAGDKPGGQKLLVEVVTADPRNEIAWFWLAAVVPADKRIYCLEKVLSINPANAQAQKLVQELKAPKPEAVIAPQLVMQVAVLTPPVAPAAVAPPAAPAETIQQAAPAKIAEQPAPTALEYWTVVTLNKLVRLIIFQDGGLIQFVTQPEKVPLVLAAMNSTSISKEWVSKNIDKGAISYQRAPLSRILRVRLLLNTIKVEYRDENRKDVSIEIECREENIAAAVMASLQKRLGDQFTSQARQTSRRNVALLSSIFLFVPLCGTGLFYWMAQEAVGTEINSGSARARSIGHLLQALGPNGVLCIGAILILIGVIIAAGLLLKPPTETLLVRKGLSDS